MLFAYDEGMGAPLDTENHSPLQWIHILERHRRTFVVHPDMAPGVEASIDQLMADPRFKDFPRPAVIVSDRADPTEPYALCHRCIYLINHPESRQHEQRKRG